ncbi:MAG: biotin transporter BioY [bacterium]
MQSRTYKLILVALFAALTAIGAFLKIPTPVVPFTLQFLFSAYAGIFLGAKFGFYSQVLYVGMGLAGVPIFANGGGITYVFQPTFGYLLGFILSTFLIGFLTERTKNLNFFRYFLLVYSGLMLIYLAGVSYLYLIFNFYMGQSLSISQAIVAGFIPYILSDSILTVIVAFTACKVVPVLKSQGYILAKNTI